MNSAGQTESHQQGPSALSQGATSYRLQKLRENPTAKETSPKLLVPQTKQIYTPQSCCCFEKWCHQEPGPTVTRTRREGVHLGSTVPTPRLAPLRPLWAVGDSTVARDHGISVSPTPHSCHGDDVVWATRSISGQDLFTHRQPRKPFSVQFSSSWGLQTHTGSLLRVAVTGNKIGTKALPNSASVKQKLCGRLQGGDQLLGHW